MIADMESNKKLMLPVYISQSCFNVPYYIRLDETRYFIMSIPNKKKLQQISLYQ